MASIKKVRNGWRARWRTPDGGSRSRTFGRRVDAERFLTTVEGSKLTGNYIDPSAGKILFGEYAETWRAGQVWRASSAANAERALRLHALPRFGKRPLASIRPSEIQTWARSLSDQLAPNTVSSIVSTVSAVFKAAIADRVIAVSPCAGVKLPEVEPARVRVLTTEQVRALEAAMPERYQALVVVGAGTGLRISEALGLTVDRIDFLRRMLTVDRQLVGDVHGPPKTKASHRTIPLPDVVLDALSRKLATYPTDGLVFTNEAGVPIRRNRFSDVWTRARHAAGLPANVTYHDLRHYYASLLIRHGESVKTVQARLGHASASETLDTYSHLWPDSEDRTRAAIDAVLGDVAEPEHAAR